MFVRGVPVAPRKEIAVVDVVSLGRFSIGCCTGTGVATESLEPAIN